MKTINLFSSRRAGKSLLVLSTATVLLAATAVRADSPSDLLEQGIYSEETKGDIETAMQLYQKVIAQSKADQAIAAQAQYHLGACYYKKQDFTNATAAFESLIKNYPDQTNIVARAQKYLDAANPGLQPAPWADNEDTRLEVKLGGGLKIGFMENSAAAGETNGQKTWRFSSRTIIGDNQSVSHVEVDAATLKPLHSVWKHTLLGEVEAAYATDHADLKFTGKEESKKIEFQGSVIDNEETLQWMRCLPLADGYKTSQQILASLGSHVIPLTFTVSGPEQVKVPAGTYQCYKVELSINQTFWYSSDPKHYLVKFEASGVIAELTGVTYPLPGADVTYSDSTFGFTVSAPAGWALDKQEHPTTNKTGVMIVDPRSIAMSSLTVETMSTVKTNESASLRAYAQARLDDSAKEYKSFKVRANSWTDLTVAGQPAVSVVADYVQGENKKVGYGTWSFGPTNAVYFEALVPAADFEAFQPKFDKVIQSLQSQ
jgi:hypothetical protein